jgi:hypothetical protein
MTDGNALGHAAATAVANTFHPGPVLTPTRAANPNATRGWPRPHEVPR